MLQVIRSGAGKEAAEGRVAIRRAAAEVRAEEKAKAVAAIEERRCRQSKAFWCRCQPDGNAVCNWVGTERGMREHIRVGKHWEGLIRPYRTGVTAGRSSANDRDVQVVRTALSGVRVVGAVKSAELQLEEAKSFRLTLCDGKEYVAAPAAAGWARSQRLPSVRSTVAQLEFVTAAYHLGQQYSQVKLTADVAHELMSTVGLSQVASQYSRHPYFGVDLGKRRFPRNDVLEVPKIKSYFNKGAKLNSMFERARKRGEVPIEQDSDSDSEVDEDGLEKRSKKKKKKKKATAAAGTSRSKGGGGSGGGGSGATEMVATEAVKNDTPLDLLSSALVSNSRIGTTTAKRLPEATGVQTCGEFVDVSVVAVGKMKARGFPHLLELHTALRRRLRAEDGGVTSGGGSGAAGNGASSGNGTESGGVGIGGEGRGGASDRDAVPPVEEDQPSAVEEEPSRDDGTATEEEIPSYCSLCGVTEADWLADEREVKLYTALDDDDENWFIDEHTGQERCGRCHYENGHQHLFDGEEEHDDHDSGGEDEHAQAYDAASDSDEFSSDEEDEGTGE